jgi:hypothetical protein
MRRRVFFTPKMHMRIFNNLSKDQFEVESFIYFPHMTLYVLYGSKQ